MMNDDRHTLSHLDSNGDIAMVDVSNKKPTTRQAHAIGKVRIPEAVYQQIKAADGLSKKAVSLRRLISQASWQLSALMI